MTADFATSTVLGYPRIGPARELKWALESYWDGRSSLAALHETGARLREQTWQLLASLGLGGIPSNTFSYYDQMLDTAILVGAVPERYRDLSTMDAYFAMARGTAEVAPLPMTKWCDTNYHYIVPEIGPDTPLRACADKPVAELREAPGTRPVLIGPVTFLLLSRPAPGAPAGWQPLARLDQLVDVYAEVLATLAVHGAAWVQLDEPALVADRDDAELRAVRRAYQRLGALTRRPKLFVASYFGELGEALPVLCDTPVEAIGLDLVHGNLPGDLKPLADKTVVAGVVSARNVWRTDPLRAESLLWTLRGAVAAVAVSTAGSLLHVPYRLEPGLDPQVFAFAEEKVAEVVALAAAPRSAPLSAPAAPAVGVPAPAPPAADRSAYPVRAEIQSAHVKLPAFPVTAIGSFPQTGQLRAARAALAAGRLSTEDYERAVADEIERVVRLQERLGLDVLVHGEPERNDMVQYFAERLDGFLVTGNGWVQSYGSRCTRPPILHGDVRRRAPITVRWAQYAQSLTDRPVKGMLTGPVTIVAWSYVRPDRPLAEITRQVAQAVREEARDLADAGIAIIQVDEPALRELLPLRRRGQAEYLAWAVGAYRYATSGVDDRVQIHTHLCYSDAGQILAAIDALDADVTTVESARSDGRLLPALAGFGRGIGPGVYDIHSPRVPSVEEVTGLLTRALAVVPADRLWVNPDCGLKTRTYPEVEAALSNVVEAASRLRAGSARYQPASRIARNRSSALSS